MSAVRTFLPFIYEGQFPFYTLSELTLPKVAAMTLRQELKSAIRSTTRNTLIFAVCVSLLGLFAYWKFGDLGQEVHVEAMFDRMRSGQYSTMAEIDQKLEWLTRSEINRGDISPFQFSGRDLDLVRERQDTIFVSYYLGAYGFIVVFDQEKRRLTELSSDI